MFRLARIITASSLLAATLLCTAYTVPAYAAMSKGEAAAKAKSRHNGKVMSVEHVRSHEGRDTYRVKLLLKDGRVKTVTVSG